MEHSLRYKNKSNTFELSKTIEAVIYLELFITHLITEIMANERYFGSTKKWKKVLSHAK